MSEQSITGQPALFGGITRQPESVRQPHQVSDAVNVTFSVVNGMTKRPPTWWVADFLDAPTATDLRLHPIDRDEFERYIVVYGLNYLAIAEAGGRRTGTRATVNLGSGVATYLALNNASASQIGMKTIGDTTFIWNKTVPIALLASPNYTTTNTYRNYDIMTSDSPTSGTYHRATADTTEQAAGYWLYDLTEGGSGTFAQIRFFQNGAGTNDQWWAVSNGYWDDSSYSGGPLRGTIGIGFQKLDMNINNGTWTAASRTLTSAGAFTSYTFVEGDQIYITAGTGMTAGWYTIASRIDANSITLVAASTGLSGADNVDTDTDAIGVLGIATIDRPGIGAADMYDVALNIQSGLRSGGGVLRDAIVKWTAAGAGGYFTIISPYRGTTATVFPAINLSVAGDYNYTAATAPFSATAGQYTITAGTGSPTALTLSVEDRWTRQSPPNQPGARVDPATMPVKMVRTSIGSGATPAVFDVSQITWGSRPSGDEDSNPLPDLFTEGERIADVSFHLDRFVLVGGEYVAFSESGNYFNFFQQDEGTLVDSDAFGRQVSSDAVTRIDFAVPLQKTLYLFTRAGRQFSISSPEALTPGTASVTPTTTYQTLPVRPVPIHDRLLLIGSEKDKASLREYEYVQDRESNEARDVSAHVPGLLPGTIHDLATSPNDHVAVLAASGSDTLYVYRAHWSGQEKIQSAWTTFELSSAGVFGVAAIKSDIYVLMRRSEIGVTVERFGVGDVVEDSADDLYPPNIAYPAEAFAYVDTPTIGGAVSPSPAIAYALSATITGVTDDGGGGGSADQNCDTDCLPAIFTGTDCSFCAPSYVTGGGNVFVLCRCLPTLRCVDGGQQSGYCCYSNPTIGQQIRFQFSRCTDGVALELSVPDGAANIIIGVP
jgi:hypothetical protein